MCLPTYAGILSIRNGIGLGYPFGAVLACLSDICDVVVLGLDPGFPADYEYAQSLGLHNLKVVDAPWDMSNRDRGSEIAIQMQKLVDYASEEYQSPFVVVLQADEVLHEKDKELIRTFMSAATSHENHKDITGFSLERLYFWKDLKTVRSDWNAKLIRIFRPGYHSFLAEGIAPDGMYTGQIKPGVVLDLPYKIYHYSRVDNDPTNISRRVRNLDGFFHTEESLLTEDALPPYDFKTRAYDNYSTVETPPEVEGEFEGFTETHPCYLIACFLGDLLSK